MKVPVLVGSWSRAQNYYLLRFGNNKVDVDDDVIR